MAEFQPPPTWAEVILVDKEGKNGKFNPVWLKWFVDLIEFVNAVGGVSGVNHNDTTNLQGGTANQYYHLTLAQQLVAVAHAAGTLKVTPTTPAGAAQTAVDLYGGTGAPSNGDGTDGDIYFRSDGGVLTTIYQRRAGTWVGIV